MKYLFLILIFMISFNAFSQFGQQEERDDRISNTLGLDPKNFIWGGKKNDNGIRRNPAGLAFKGGANLNVNYWEFGAHLNTFQHINYYALGLSFHREFATFNLDKSLYNNGSTLAFLVGGEAQLAFRRGADVGGGIPKWKLETREYFNYSLSFIIRYDRPFGLPGFIEYQATGTHRSDIKDTWGDNSKYSAWDNPSGYVKVGFYFVEIFNW